MAPPLQSLLTLCLRSTQHLPLCWITPAFLTRWGAPPGQGLGLSYLYLDAFIEEGLAGYLALRTCPINRWLNEA